METCKGGGRCRGGEAGHERCSGVAACSPLPRTWGPAEARAPGMRACRPSGPKRARLTMTSASELGSGSVPNPLVRSVCSGALPMALRATSALNTLLYVDILLEWLVRIPPAPNFGARRNGITVQCSRVFQLLSIVHSVPHRTPRPIRGQAPCAPPAISLTPRGRRSAERRPTLRPPRTLAYLLRLLMACLSSVAKAH